MERLTQVRTGACFGRLVGSVDVWRLGVSGEALRGVTTNRARPGARAVLCPQDQDLADRRVPEM